MKVKKECKQHLKKQMHIKDRHGRVNRKGTKKNEERKRVKWDKQTGSHPESWKQKGTGGCVQ